MCLQWGAVVAVLLAVLSAMLLVQNRYYMNARNALIIGRTKEDTESPFIHKLREKKIKLIRTSSGYSSQNDDVSEDIEIANSETDQSINQFTKKQSSDSTLRSTAVTDITLVSYGNLSQIDTIVRLQRYWTGPISIALCITKGQSLPSHFSSILKHTVKLSTMYSQTGICPVGSLRNLAIRITLSTHILLYPLDGLPSEHLYETILKIPKWHLADKSMAIIVPKFDLLNSNTEKEKNEISLPLSKSQLVECFKNDICHPLSTNYDEMSILLKQWLGVSSQNRLFLFACLHEDSYENVIVIKKSKYLPEFDESAPEAEYSDQQWIEHLRYRGYHFGLFTRGYVLHLSNSTETSLIKPDNNSRLVESNSSYRHFKERLHHVEEDQSIISYC